MGKVNFISELQHQLAVYFEFQGVDTAISPEENAADLIMHLHKNNPGNSIRAEIKAMLGKPRKEFPPRKISHPVTDYEALRWAIVEVERIEQLYG